MSRRVNPSVKPRGSRKGDSLLREMLEEVKRDRAGAAPLVACLVAPCIG